MLRSVTGENPGEESRMGGPEAWPDQGDASLVELGTLQHK